MTITLEQLKDKSWLLWDEDIDDCVEIVKKAYQMGMLAGHENKRIFVGRKWFFRIVKMGGKPICTTHKMRDNWNGWHDLAFYELPDFTEIGKRIMANPSEGIHRDTVVL